MVGPAAAAGAAGAARAGIFVFASSNAARVLGSVGTAAGGLGANLAKATAVAYAFSLGLSGVQKVLGLVGLGLVGTSTALETRRWLQFNVAVRRANLQLAGLGLTLSSTQDQLDYLRRTLGRTGAEAFFRSQEAMKQWALTMDIDMRQALMDFSVELSEKMGTGPEGAAALFAAFGVAFNEGVFEPINAIMGWDVSNLDELNLAIAAAAAASKELDTTNLEKLSEQIERWRDLVGPWQAWLVNLGAGITVLGNMIVLAPLEAAARNLERFAEGLDVLADAVERHPFAQLFGYVYRFGQEFTRGLGGQALLQTLGALFPGISPGALKNIRPALEGLWAAENLPPPIALRREWRSGEGEGGPIAEAIPSGPSGQWMVVNFTIDGEVLRSYIVNTVTREVRESGDSG